MRIPVLTVLALLFAPLTAFAGPSAPPAVAPPANLPQMYVNHGYDPAADPAADVARAAELATAQHKRILLVIGGEWCSWCTILDRFLGSNADVRAEFADSFVMVKVNWDPDHPNARFLGRFPVAPGYPDFIVLDSHGRYLAHQPTEELEQGYSYHHDRMVTFARAWRAARR